MSAVQKQDSPGQMMATKKQSFSSMLPLEPRSYKEFIGDKEEEVSVLPIDSHSQYDIDPEEETRAVQETFNAEEFREKLRVAEALARASDMTSMGAKRRLEARQMEMDMFKGEEYCPDNDYRPPKELLIYIMRMGSFNSVPKIHNTDHMDDDDEEPPNAVSLAEFVEYCKTKRGVERPPLLERSFLKPNGSVADIRLLQWNILSQSLGEHNDGFVQCPREALTWKCRKYQILQEIIQTSPDLICLQEVDHFKFLQRTLGTLGYTGVFFPKPDSPCLYIEDNNGPDGCAIFYRTAKYSLVKCVTRVLEVWRVQSNQIIIGMVLKGTNGGEFCVATTHLKARESAILSKLRNEQGKDVLSFVKSLAEGRPIILCGDFNAEPIEPVYSTILNDNLGLSSAYADVLSSDQDNGECVEGDRGVVKAKSEPKYTTWKIRENGEVCHCIDYVFYSEKNFKVLNCLSFPEDIEPSRLPSFRYPSDHMSLVCDFQFL